MKTHRRPAPRLQQGIVLPVVLIMLLVMTISSIVIVEQISSQTRMATNTQVQQVTLQAAEAALKTVSNRLFTGAITSATSAYEADANGFYFYSPSSYSASTPLPWNTTTAWTTAQSDTTVCGSLSSQIISSCKYMIEMLPKINTKDKGWCNVFRITALVTGPSNHGQVMLQTIYLLPISA
jgi:type IV pilus assembly protein PilX